MLICKSSKPHSWLAAASLSFGTTAVGIAKDIVQGREQLTDSKRYQYYLPVEQNRLRGPSTRFMVRVMGDPGAQAEQLRRWLQLLGLRVVRHCTAPARHVGVGAPLADSL